MRFDRVGRADFINQIMEEQRLNATDVYPFEEAWVRDFAERSYDRAYKPEGVVRQLQAMLTKLGEPFTDHTRLTMPVVLIHGRDDIRVRAEASMELAQLIPHAELHLYPGMGHFVVEPLWTEFADIITRTARRAQGAKRSS
jgi:pimeloyl-ACP methyl ester carboxylesterase